MGIYEVVRRYSLHDLLYLRGILEREMRNLPPSYRNRLFPKILEQIFGTHHVLIALHHEGRFTAMTEPLDPSIGKYLEMVDRVCTGDRTYLHPRFDLLYFLLSAFCIFVLGLPGHPVGTPFPGGLQVRREGDRFICPIRQKEDDVENAICPFCPAHPG